MTCQIRCTDEFLSVPVHAVGYSLITCLTLCTLSLWSRLFHHWIWTRPLLQIGMSVKNQNRMANSVDPNETAHYSCLIRTNTVCIGIYCPFDITRKDAFAWRFILNENILFWMTISYQKPFVFSVSVFYFQICTQKLNLWPKIGLTYAIFIVKWFFGFFY